jgi:hypothetical protein
MARNILIVGYLKSGTTWLGKLIAEIISAPSYGQVTRIYSNGEFDHLRSGIGSEGLDRVSNYKVYKTHFPATCEKKDRVLDAFKKSDIIYIARDPRDIVCSFIANSIPRFQTKEEEIGVIKEKAKDRIVNMSGDTNSDMPYYCEDWNEHVAGYINNGYFYVTYESLLKNTYQEATRILDFLKIEIPEGHIRKSIKAQSFTVKKKIYSSDSWDDGRNPGLEKFLRQGKSGTYKDEMSKEDIEFANKRFKEGIELLGYER